MGICTFTRPSFVVVGKTIEYRQAKRYPRCVYIARRSVQGQNCPNAHPRNVYHTRSIIFCIVLDTRYLKFPTFQTTKNKHRSDAFMYVTAVSAKTTQTAKDKCREFWKLCGRNFRPQIIEHCPSNSSYKQ